MTAKMQEVKNSVLVIHIKECVANRGGAAQIRC